MNDQLPEKRAWAWYSLDTLALMHVGFHEDSDHGLGLGIIEIAYDTALDIASGKSRFFEYEIHKNGDSVTFHYVNNNSQPPKQFWNLINPETTEFNARFNTTASKSSPVIVKEKSQKGFVVDIIHKATNVVFYITMKNDPNYLIEKIDLYPYAELAESVSDIEIPLDLEDGYSIYVRYDAT
jgi:hypothetical protein